LVGVVVAAFGMGSCLLVSIIALRTRAHRRIDSSSKSAAASTVGAVLDLAASCSESPSGRLVPTRWTGSPGPSLLDLTAAQGRPSGVRAYYVIRGVGPVGGGVRWMCVCLFACVCPQLVHVYVRALVNVSLGNVEYCVEDPMHVHSRHTECLRANAIMTFGCVHMPLCVVHPGVRQRAESRG
jgi:hypothetical protein